MRPINSNESLWNEGSYPTEAPKMRRLDNLYDFSNVDNWTTKQNEDSHILDKIRSFSELPDGWHYGEGRGATEQAQEMAKMICSQLPEFGIDIKLFPGIYGGITIFGCRDSHFFEIFCSEDGLIDILHEFEGNTLSEQDDKSLGEAIQYLRDQLWDAESWMESFLKEKSLGFSTLYYSTKNYNDLQAMLLPGHQKTAVYQFSLQNAPEDAAVLNADTFVVTTQILTHPSYGEYFPASYLQPQN